YAVRERASGRALSFKILQTGGKDPTQIQAYAGGCQILCGARSTKDPARQVVGGANVSKILRGRYKISSRTPKILGVKLWGGANTSKILRDGVVLGSCRRKILRQSF
ncbi:MAG: hypothetical protein ACTTIC_08565, partial [Helicobacteraceae bacterium]